MSAADYVVAIHGGAGYHPPTSDSSLKHSLRAAISSALVAFSGATTTSPGGSSSESSALDAATALIAALEDAPDFNAGYGSNLTFDGNVECDASLMSAEDEGEGRGTAAASSSSSSSFPFSFGSVGAVRGVRNPVSLARRVLEGRRTRARERERGRGREREGRVMGRVPPLMLVGEGALQFAREQRGAGVCVVDDPEEMVAPRARREWRVWRERWEEDEVDSESRDPTPSTRTGTGGSRCDLEVTLTGSGGGASGDTHPLRMRQDTVGAVVLVGGTGDVKQQVAAGVSSGGLLLKHSGRVGEAAVFGAGCWAERLAGGRRIACSVSGQGELIVQSSLAKTLAERIAANTEEDVHDILRSILVDQFYAKWHQLGERQPAVGVLLLTQGVDGDESTTTLWCAFTTQSMAIAYASSRHPKPKATVLRNPDHDFRDDDGRPPLFITSFPF